MRELLKQISKIVVLLFTGVNRILIQVLQDKEKQFGRKKIITLN